MHPVSSSPNSVSHTSDVCWILHASCFMVFSLTFSILLALSSVLIHCSILHTLVSVSMLNSPYYPQHFPFSSLHFPKYIIYPPISFHVYYVLLNILCSSHTAPCHHTEEFIYAHYSPYVMLCPQGYSICSSFSSLHSCTHHTLLYGLSLYSMLYSTHYMFPFSLASFYSLFTMNFTAFPSSSLHPLFPYSIPHSTDFSTPPAPTAMFFLLFSLSLLHALSSYSRFHPTYAISHTLCGTTMLEFLFSTLLTLVHILWYILHTPHFMLHPEAGPFCLLFSSLHSVFPCTTLHCAQPVLCTLDSVQHVTHDSHSLHAVISSDASFCLCYAA